MDLRSAIEKLSEDERLRSNMTDAYAAIWLHAAGEHVRQASRESGDIAVAYNQARAALVAINAAMATAGAITIDGELARR